MQILRKLGLLLMFLLSLVGCSSSESKDNQLSEKISRRRLDRLYWVEPMSLVKKQAYPWEEGNGGAFPKLTKEFFRCKGSSLNPVNIIQKEKEQVRYYDCGGAQRHSLPLKDQKEFIYPILIDLLNDLQTKTGKKVVITCGHCCPDHNIYLDPSISNQSSKHLIGAEVDFYVQGMESNPEKVVELIKAYYREQPKYKGMKEYEEFKNYDTGKTNVSTPPWYNKEIFIKLVKKGEGRDFDNRHPYAYITVQVRYDWEKQEQVSYTWEKAFRNFHRW